MYQQRKHIFFFYTQSKILLLIIGWACANEVRITYEVLDTCSYNDVLYIFISRLFCIIIWIVLCKPLKLYTSTCHQLEYLQNALFLKLKLLY